MNYIEEFNKLAVIAQEIKGDIEKGLVSLDGETIQKLVPVVDAMMILGFLQEKKTEFSLKYMTKKGSYSDCYILNIFLEDDSKGFKFIKSDLTNILNNAPKRFRFSDNELIEHKVNLSLNAIIKYLPHVFYGKCYYATSNENGYENVVEFDLIENWIDWIDRDCDAIEPVISERVTDFTECPIGGPPPGLNSPIQGRKAIPNAVGVDKQVKLKFEVEKEGLSKIKPRYEFLADLDVNVDLEDLEPQQLMDFEYIYNILFNRQWESALNECKDFEYGVIVDSSQILVLEVEDDFEGGFMFQNIEELVDNVQTRQNEI